jgi:hypothetical protein
MNTHKEKARPERTKPPRSWVGKKLGLGVGFNNTFTKQGFLITGDLLLSTAT